MVWNFQRESFLAWLADVAKENFKIEVAHSLDQFLDFPV